MVAIDSVPAGTAVPAGRGGAFIYVYAAVFAGEARPAVALVVIIQYVTFATVSARLREAEVDPCLTSRSEESRRALAPLTVDEVHACPSVFTHYARTVVYVYLTPVPSESCLTRTSKSISSSIARGSVSTGVDGARVRLHGTV